MAMTCTSQVCLGRGVCILFQKGISAYWSWSDGMEPIICICAGIGKAMRRIDGHPFIPGGKKHEGSCCLCAKGSRVNFMSCC